MKHQKVDVTHKVQVGVGATNGKVKRVMGKAMKKKRRKMARRARRITRNHRA